MSRAVTQNYLQARLISSALPIYMVRSFATRSLAFLYRLFVVLIPFFKLQ